MENSTKGLLKKWHALVAIFFLAAFATNVQAQNVTIRPNNGSLITGQAGGNTGDSGIGRGMASMWRHEQLPLMMTTSDIANLTSAGELADPSCAIDVYNGKLIIGAGQTQTFVVVSLPKGYRILGYELVLQPDVYGNNIQLHPGKNSWNIGTDDQMSFYETPAWSSGSPYGDNTHSTQLTCSDALATATDADGNTVMQNDNATNRAKRFTIKRTSQTDTDMTNQLHFFFARGSSQYAVSIVSFEIQFTAEGTFDAEVTPETLGPAVSMVRSPFSTSKMDVGAITVKDGVYTYDYTGVRDLIAYNWVYQKDAVQGGKPADVATNQNIHPVVVDGKSAYAFGNDTYFVEPPTTIRTASGWESPIGFRIVGAKFEYDWGTATPGGTQTITNGYRISVTRQNATYYLNDNLDFVQVNQNNAFVWSVDEFGNLYHEYTDASGVAFRKYLACFGSGNERVLSLSVAASGHEATWNLRVRNDGRVYYHSDGGNDYLLNFHYIQEGQDYHLRGYVSTTYTNGSLATATAITGTHTVDLPSYTPGAYTLKIYGTDKDTPVKTVTVNSASDVGSFELLGINNDAVKFEISGLGDNTQALVNVSLQLEALNPYINSMDIVCESEADADGKKLELIQTFTANDFAVSGGKFVFYIPTDYSDHDLTFTFRDLFSQFGDVTYGGKGNARYSYVTSPYFETVDGNGDNGLYDSAYDPNHECTDKIYTSVAGNIRFKFNNAEELTGSGSDEKTLEEYPFSVAEYLGGYEDPDGTDKKGAFNTIIMNAKDNKSGIYYVFTADETRYNIAPTTALEHRSYAFYRMDIELVAKNYIPGLEWTKLYEHTCYAEQDENGKDIDADKEMWGLKLIAKDIDDETHEEFVVEDGVGYLSVKEISETIDAAFENPGENQPTSRDQILYVDGSKLNTIVASTGHTFEELRTGLGANSLVYLPENITSTADNFAFKTTSGSFMAGRNIVLTDRKPFYAPYDIQVQAAPNNITYTRDITWQTNGQVTNASVIVPFEIAVDANGVHEDSEGNKFTVHQIQADGDCISDDPQSDDDYIHVLPLAGMKKTEPNVPYVVKVDKVVSATGSTASFVVKQTGALLKATTGMDTNYEFSGTAGKGKAESDIASVTFTPTGSFSGKLLAKASNSVYYFAHNMFLDIKTLNRANLYVYPFRAYFRTTGGTGAKGLNIFYGENFDTTGITQLEEDQPVMVDPNAPVYDVYGRMVANTVREIAGKKLPRGIYVVKGIKFNVK